MESLGEQCLGCSDLCLNTAQQAAGCGCAALGSKISQISRALFQLAEQREAPELCQKFTDTPTHPPQHCWTLTCRALLLPQWGRCWDCSACGQILGNTYCGPQTRALRDKNVKFCSSRCSQHHTNRIGTSPGQAQAWGGGGGGKAAPGLWQDCCRGLACATPPPTPAGSPGWLLAEIQGKKALRCSRLSLRCCWGLWITNIYKRALEAVLQAWPLAELSLVLYPIVSELGGCTWQVVTSHLCQAAHFHYTPFSPSFFYLWWRVHWPKATWEALVTTLN